MTTHYQPICPKCGNDLGEPMEHERHGATENGDQFTYGRFCHMCKGSWWVHVTVHYEYEMRPDK